MGSLRKQTIISSLLVYVGFLIGVVNMYFYTKNGSFTPEQYALTKFFFDCSQIMFAFGSLGMMSVIFKFYPYYKDNLEEKKIDLMTWAMLLALAGFILILLAGWLLQPLFIRKFNANSRLAIDYYIWLFPFAMGMLFFSVLESFAWAVHKSIVSNFLKETALRILTTVIILLFYLKVINFSVFMYLFAFQYLVVFLVLAVYLVKIGRLHFTLRVSKVTRRYWKKMVNMQALIFSGTVIAAIASTIDSLIIASIKGLTAAGIFVFAQYAANFIQVPQRSIQSVSAGVLSRAWKEKNYREIARIYQRSCINLLLLALLIFGNLWLNIRDAIGVLHIQDTYLEGMNVMFLLGIVRIIDAGTGLNGMVISTSTLWRFDFVSGVILLTLRLPLTYYLISSYGIIGSAIAELVAYSLFNFVRYEFLRRKFNMQPFNRKTLYSLLLAAGAYLAAYFLFRGFSGWTAIILRAGLFTGLMIAGIFYGKLTPDAHQMFEVFVRWFKRQK